MKHLSRFNEYELIDEKLNWKNFLLWLGLGTSAYIATPKIKDAIHVNSIYKSIINNGKATSQEAKLLEPIRHNLIEKIKKSNKFNKFNKQWVIDSMININFRIYDSSESNVLSSASKETKAVFIQLGEFTRKNKILNRFVESPTDENLIIIRRSYINDVDLDMIIYHELYHYLDKLYGDDKQSYSDKIKTEDFLDKKVPKDMDYTIKKFLLFIITDKVKDYKKAIHLNPNDDLISYIGIKDVFIDAAKDYIKDLDFKYLSDSRELFARWNTLKMDLLSSGVIDNINDTVSLDDIGKYLNDKNVSKERKFIAYDILLQLDLNKIDELQKAFDN